MLDPIAQREVWRAHIRICAERNIGILAISHDLALLDKVASRTVWL